jgi:hypothetical protein
MIRIKDITTALLSLVGWRQSYNPQKAIDDDLLVSESGLYFQDAHPLMTLENVASVMPDEFMMQYPAWNAATEYKKGRKVSHGGYVWVAKQDNINKEPPASDFNGDYSDEDFGGDYWRAYNLLSDYLRQQTESGIAQMVQTFLQIKSLLKESKDLLERRTFFDGAGRLTNLQQNQGKLVGFEINPVRAIGVTAKIERIGLQMTGATGVVRVYLFHSSQVDPIKVADLEFTKENGGFQWFDMKDWYMPYISKDTNSGGSWYLVYNQNDLPQGMMAVTATKDWSREPCMTCNPGSVAAWRELTKYLLISPFKVNALETFKEYPEMWDVEDNIYTNTANYGLNVEVSVGCDLTDFIISQRMMFATVLQRQVTANLLRTMAMNPDVRVNRNQSNVSVQSILYELDGNPQGRETGLGYELKKGYEALDLNTRDIDRICLTCRPIGVRYRTV